MNKYTEVTFELFEDAIRALYGQDGPEQQRLANEYLVHVWNQCKQSWEYGLRVLVRPVVPGQGDPTQTQYFCANMLYGKIRQEWFGLTTGEQEAIQLQVELLIQRIRSGSLSFAPIVLKRICMAMTALSLATDGGCARCVTDCTQHVSSLVDVHVSLELLTSLVDDTDDAYLPPSRKDALVLEITDASAVVFPFVARLFDTQQLSSDVLRLNGLTCLRVWIKAAGFSLAKLYSNMPAVFQALLQALHHPQTAPGPVKEVVVCALILSDALEINEYPPATSKDAATAALLSTLLTCQPTIQYYLLHDAQVAHAITTLISTLGEAELDWLVLGSPDALAFSDLVLTLTSQPRRQIACLTFDVWLGIQDYPVASRHVAFQDAAFRRLLHTLVRQSCASDDDDEPDDDVTAFRLAATDLLVAIHHLLKASFVADMVHLITSSKVATEAAMFALTAVSSELKLRLADDLPTQQMVLHLCTSILFADVTPSVVVVASAFLGNMGPLIHAQWTTHGAADTSLLDATFQYLCFGMTVSVASSAACRAFNILCASCTSILSQRHEIVSTALGSLHASLGHLDKQDRQWVVEGVVRVAAVSAWGRLALEQLLHSIFIRLAVPSSPTPSHVPMELHALGTVLRFLDAPSAAAGGPALTQHVVDLSWPHITRVASAAPSLPLDVVDALCDVFSATLHAMKHTPAFVSSVECWSLLSWIEGHSVTSSAAIPCAIVAVELYSSHLAPSSPIIHVIVAIGHDVMTHCQSVPSPRHIPDLIRAYFELVQRALVFCPSSIVSDAEFPPILHLAIACLMDLNQREALRAVVVFVNHVVAKREAPPLVQFQSIVDTVLTAQLTPLWVAIMTLLTSTGPTTVLPTVSHLAFGLLTAFGNDMHMAAVADAMLSQHHLFESTPLSLSDRRQVLSAWLQYTTNYEERKFTAFVKDFAKVCRKELPVEHLVDHFVALQDK